MKILIQDYSFNALDKTITFNAFSTISIRQLFLITNITKNKIIYNFAAEGYGGTTKNNILTLEYNTKKHSNTDILAIHYDVSLLTNVDEVNASTTYVGKATIGTSTGAAMWQIMLLTTTGTALETTYADGNERFDNIWSNRANLTYS